MFDTLLIANRGEIACRVMRTATRMGLRTVAVYSDADAHAQHVRLADAAERIGPAPARESYLRIDAVLDAAERHGAGAVHPGYGFLSENAEFAAACEERGIVFVGPSARAIRAMGSKIEAKRIVAAAGTPVVPGYQEADQSDAALSRAAAEIGYPLLIKASAGGGGKGMRLVREPDEFPAALAGARREAAAAFADELVLLERYLDAPKHLEVQILADQTGHTLHLYERDCSVQRRHQKVIEEAPGPTVSEELRTLLGEAAVQAAKAIGYVGAGTVEFISQAGEFYFMEMNTRLQVEHPVTEAITGLDLVEWQLRVAAGEKLPFRQHEIPRNGHAVEARVYAENPARRFLPSTGTLAHVAFPQEVRVDAGVATGDAVSVHYDPMLAKVIAHGPDRDAAITSLERALARTEIAGVAHNVAYLRRLLAHPVFRGGDYTTGIAEEHADELLAEEDHLPAICAAIAAGRLGDSVGPWARRDGFRLNGPASFIQRFRRERKEVEVVLSEGQAQVDGEVFDVADVSWNEGVLALRVDGNRVGARVVTAGPSLYVIIGGSTARFDPGDVEGAARSLGSAAGNRVVSPMPGQVIAVSVKPGDRVKAGAVLAVVEAMKMEHSVAAPRAGRVASVNCRVGDRVDEGVELVVLEE
ncbi:MAG TPA: biotin carboxylase N-terminal domain-containing protein [Pseudomonadales bacterium]|jgi:3-methylcrotonyl-CoA carboxylase alpha subunit